MTCQDLHNYFEGDPRVGSNRLSEIALAEHITVCLLCNRFVEEQQELEQHLLAVRDSVPPVPVCLDHAVLANYRGFVLSQSRLAKSNPRGRRINLRAALGWVAAVTFAVVVAYGGALLLVPRQYFQVDRQYTLPQAITAQAQATLNKETAIPRKTPKSHGDSGKRANNRALLAEGDNSFPTGFQSLMYCDQISCPGAMDVIRVRLSSPVMGLTPSSARMGGTAFADVLVGPDGIARGIRVVE